MKLPDSMHVAYTVLMDFIFRVWGHHKSSYGFIQVSARQMPPDVIFSYLQNAQQFWFTSPPYTKRGAAILHCGAFYEHLNSLWNLLYQRCSKCCEAKKYCQNLTQNFISTSNPKFSYKKIGAKYEQKNPVGVSLHNLKFEKHIFFWKLVKSVHHVAKTTQYWCVLLKYVSQW